MTVDTAAVQALLEQHAELERRLSDPALHSDQEAARKAGRRYGELSRIVRVARELNQARSDLEAARELAEDPAFAAEAETLAERIPELEAELSLLLVPRDPHDDSDVVMEIKSGEGGAESALFAGDLLRMYLRYAERQGWRTEVLDSTEAELGGYKDVTLAIKSGSAGTAEFGVWERMKFEGGVHRVQRVPVTESSGRIHTSAAGVLVYPERDEIEIEVDEKDLRIDVYRSSGPGGQSVNTTDSAVRVTHLPTGTVVSCQNEKSQIQNRLRAITVLRARLQAVAEEKAQQEAFEQRRAQVRTVDRSERVRTYNYPENRISDHRVNYKSYNLDAVLDGDLDGVLDALAAADRELRMSES